MTLLRASTETVTFEGGKLDGEVRELLPVWTEIKVHAKQQGRTHTEKGGGSRPVWHHYVRRPAGKGKARALLDRITERRIVAHHGRWYEKEA